MKILINKHQFRNLLSEDIMRYDSTDLKNYNLVVNKILKKKYDWFHKVDITYLSFHSEMRYIGLEGKIYVDEDWGAKQWREYHYSTPFPGNTDEYDGVSFGDIIGGDLSMEIKDIFIDNFKMLTTEFRAKTLSWSWLTTIFVENLEIEETISESIDDIRKLKVIDKVLEKEYPNQYVDEHMGSTLVFTDEKNAKIIFKYHWKTDTLYYDFDLVYEPLEKLLPFDEFEYQSTWLELLREYSEFRFGRKPKYVHLITS